MSEGGPYKLLWVGVGFWRLSVRWRPTWKLWVERTELLLVGVGTEEGV